jgi:hypothetical protein
LDAGKRVGQSSRFTRAVWPFEKKIYHVSTSGRAKEVVLTTVWLSIWAISDGCDGDRSKLPIAPFTISTSDSLDATRQMTAIVSILAPGVIQVVELFPTVYSR